MLVGKRAFPFAPKHQIRSMDGGRNRKWDRPSPTTRRPDGRHPSGGAPFPPSRAFSSSRCWPGPGMAPHGRGGLAPDRRMPPERNGGPLRAGRTEKRERGGQMVPQGGGTGVWRGETGVAKISGIEASLRQTRFANVWQTARRGRLAPPFGFANVWQNHLKIAKHWQNKKNARLSPRVLPHFLLFTSCFVACGAAACNATRPGSA